MKNISDYSDKDILFSLCKITNTRLAPIDAQNFLPWVQSHHNTLIQCLERNPYKALPFSLDELLELNDTELHDLFFTLNDTFFEFLKHSKLRLKEFYQIKTKEPKKLKQCLDYINSFDIASFSTALNQVCHFKNRFGADSFTPSKAEAILKLPSNEKIFLATFLWANIGTHTPTTTLDKIIAAVDGVDFFSSWVLEHFPKKKPNLSTQNPSNIDSYLLSLFEIDLLTSEKNLEKRKEKLLKMTSIAEILKKSKLLHSVKIEHANELFTSFSQSTLINLRGADFPDSPLLFFSTEELMNQENEYDTLKKKGIVSRLIHHRIIDTDERDSYANLSTETLKNLIALFPSCKENSLTPNAEKDFKRDILKQIGYESLEKMSTRSDGERRRIFNICSWLATPSDPTQNKNFNDLIRLPKVELTFIDQSKNLIIKAFPTEEERFPKLMLFLDAVLLEEQEISNNEEAQLATAWISFKKITKAPPSERSAHFQMDPPESKNEKPSFWGEISKKARQTAESVASKFHLSGGKKY